MHFSSGDVWDDVEKDCNDWGTKLDRQTLGDSSQDENKSNPIIQERAFLRREGAGLPAIRFHDLRHTNASLLLNQGKPVITVSRRLGHAKASITLDVYGHLISSMQNDIGDMIDDLVMPGAVDLEEKVTPGS
jgi:integrase